MDFATLPPEINSARMYSGPGSGPMLAAATAWDGLATELHAVGTGYESVISELATEWLGPTATAMAAAATPYATWMHSTGAQAEQTAGQAKAAAAAYEAAFAMTVPPAAVAANRSQLMTLLATNFLGQNTAAIAATEAHYAEMWAQDATAMYTYSGSSAAASKLTPFTEPPQTTNPAGSAGQAAAVGQAAATSAGGHAQTAASSLSAVPQLLQGLTTPATATGLGAASPAGASALLSALAPAVAVDPALAASLAGLGADLFGTFVIDSVGTFGVDVVGTFAIDVAGLGEIGGELLPFELLPFATLANSAAPITAGMGQAALVSGLSVPQAWAVAAPTVIQQVSAASATGAAAAPAVAASESAIPFAEMATAGMAGRAMAVAGRGGRGRGGTTTRQRAKAPQKPRGGPITAIAPELRELAELHNAGILTEEEFTEQKRRLLG
ncbi:MAG: PPE family protein, SVP subgroup [Mycobacterium sp.]